MNEATIAAPLFTLLASGGTMERTVAHLPVYKAQLEGAFDWMKSNAQFTEARMEQLVKRFREVVRAKEDAIVNMDFDLAARNRAEECAIFETVGLGKLTVTCHMIFDVPIDKQMQDLSALLYALNPNAKD